jgi:hypothetical protein
MKYEQSIREYRKKKKIRDRVLSCFISVHFIAYIYIIRTYILFMKMEKLSEDG